MGKLRPLPPRKIIKIIESNGFKFVKQEGSHAKYRHPDSRWTIIPMHEIVLKGTLHSIIKQTGKPREEFLE